MESRIIVAIAVALMCATALATADPNPLTRAGAAARCEAAGVSADGEGVMPTRAVRTPGDIPAGYQPPPAPAPTLGEQPQPIDMNARDRSQPVDPRPLWGPDVTVHTGGLRGPSSPGAERMIAYDQTQAGTLFAAFVAPNGDTAWVYRSTDYGNNWAPWNGMQQPGNVWSSLELVVAEGDSSFVFLFGKSSAGNGDIYAGRWALDGSTANVLQVKADADTVVNLAACTDLQNPYYLYVAYETRAASYNMYQLRSTNYGRTWTSTSGEVLDNETSPKPDICYGSGGNVYTVLRDLRQSSSDSVQLRLRQSTDRGATWLDSKQVGNHVVPVYDPVVGAKHSGGTVWLVHTRDLEAFNGTGLAVCYYYSTDAGASWRNGSFIGGVNTDNNEQMPSIACHWSTGMPAVCYVIVPSDSLMFTSCPGDTNWARPEKVNNHVHTGDFAPQAGWVNVGTDTSYSSVLYAGVGPASLYFDARNLTGIVEGRPLAQKAAAIDAWPSPARGRAVISYTLQRAGHARVSVLDVVGREVAVLAHGALAAGAHAVLWNCANVPAGVYLVRVETGAVPQTGRVLVSH